MSQLPWWTGFTAVPVEGSWRATTCGEIRYNSLPLLLLCSARNFWWNYVLHIVVYTLRTSWCLIRIFFLPYLKTYSYSSNQVINTAYAVKISSYAAAATFPFIEKHPSDWRYTRLLCVYTAVNSRFVYVSHIHHVLESERHKSPKHLFLWKYVLPGLATDFSWPHISI